MKILSLAVLILIFLGCATDTKVKELENKIDQLNLRAFHVENKLDSLLLLAKPVTGKKKVTYSLPSNKKAISNNTSSTRQSSYSGANTNKYELYSGRCQATTKKGTQCKRSSRSGGYCWQHGG